MVDKKFTDALASKAPTPGGGGASAYAGALAAALGSMVINLTQGKPQFAHVHDELQAALEKLTACREDLLACVHDDARAFSALADCWKMPKATERQKARRHEAEQDALIAACDVPMKIMRICATVIEIDEFLSHNGTRLALSDVGASAALAKAALKAAALNVYVNTSLMEDAGRAERYNNEAVDLIKRFGYMADITYDYVRHEIACL